MAEKEKDFVFDVIVTKLELANDSLPSQSVNVTFDWDDLNLKITSSRINVGEFLPERSLGFKSNVADLKKKFEETPFQLIIFDKIESEASAEKIPEVGDEEEGEILGKFGENLQTADVKVGGAECNWPKKLIDSLKKDVFVASPFLETYDLKQDEQIVGVITLSIMLHFKCEEGKRKIDSNVPYVDTDGKLGIYKDVEHILDPDDVFFVVGNPPGPQILYTNVFGSCGGQGPCPGKFVGSRYRMVRGTLVDDCDIIGPCGMADCCENKQGDDEICEEVLKGIKPQYPPGTCCMDPCEQLFGPMTDSCEGLTCTDMDLPCHAEFHTMDCDKQRRQKVRNKRKRCKCRFETPKTKQEEVPPTNEKVLREILENDPLTERRNQLLYPHTSQPPKLMTPVAPLPQRCCPICCEDVSWVPLYGSCPRCGYRAKPFDPIEQVPYDENQTAEQIIEQWKDDAKKFRRKKQIGKFGACTCSPENECINCQLRRLMPETAKKEPPKPQSYQFEEEDPGRGEKDEENNEEEHANEIVEDVLSRPEPNIRRKSSFGPKSYEIPNIAKVIEWCKKRSFVNNRFSEFSFGSATKEKNVAKCGERGTNQSKQKSDHVTIEKYAKRGSRHSTSGRKRLSELNRCQQRGSKQQSKKAKTFDKSDFPGVILGHKYCVGRSCKVPRKMGWLWNINIEKERRGWRPGAIRVNTHKIMNYFLKDNQIADDSIYDPENQSSDSVDECNKENKDVKMPTLRMIKKDGEYVLTVHPMKDANKPLDPYDMRSLPIQFNIERDSIVMIRRQIKACLKKMGFKTCTCDHTIYDCECRSGSAHDDLEEAMENLCDKMCVPQLKKTICLSDTTKSDSELEFEFSPPAAIAKPGQRKPRTVCVETQCNSDDIKAKYGNCVWTLDESKLLRLGEPCGGPTKPPPCLPPRSSKNVPPRSIMDIFPIEPPGGSPSKILKPPPGKFEKPTKPDRHTYTPPTNQPSATTNIPKQPGSKPEKPEKPNQSRKPVKPSKPNESGKSINPRSRQSDKSEKPKDNPNKPNGEDESDNPTEKPNKVTGQPDGSKKRKPHGEPGDSSDENKPTKPPPTKPNKPEKEKSTRPPKPPKPMQPRRPVKPPTNQTNTQRPKPAKPSNPNKLIQPEDPAKADKPHEPNKGDKLVKPRPTNSSQRPSKPSIRQSSKPFKPQIQSLREQPPWAGRPSKPVCVGYKIEPCQEGPLTTVKFKSHEFDKNAALTCPLVVEEKPCTTPCFKLVCPSY